MIKLGGLIDLKPITEADVFTATSKETGTTSVFKSKAARDAAIEAGTHEKRKDDKDGAQKDPTEKPKVNIFDKPKKDKAAKGGDSSAGEKDKDEPKKDDGPQKDSTGGRAGNVEVNKSVRLKAKRMGVTSKNLGKEEYERRMSQAAVEALTDSNFHSEARKLIAMLEDNPDFAKDPRKDPNMPDIMSPEYDKWRKSSVYGSEFYDSSPGTDEIGQFASQEASFDGRDALDAIAFDMKLNGSKQLAVKMQAILDDMDESTMRLNKMLPEGRPDRNLIRMAKAQNGNIKQDFEEMMDLLNAGENNDALNHIEDAISRLEDLHKVVKRKS